MKPHAIDVAVIVRAIHQLRTIADAPVGALPDRVACIHAAFALEDALRGIALPIRIETVEGITA